jgi:hypothetical protein
MSFSKFFNPDSIFSNDVIDPWLIDNAEDFLSDDSDKLSRSSKVKVNYWETTWGRWLLNPLIYYPNSKIAKLFLLRFRVPFILFQQKILSMCIKKNIFDIKVESLCKVPIEFKQL